MWFRKKEKKKDNKVIGYYCGYPVYRDNDIDEGINFLRGGGWMRNSDYFGVRSAEESSSFHQSNPSVTGTSSAYNPYVGLSDDMEVQALRGCLDLRSFSEEEIEKFKKAWREYLRATDLRPPALVPASYQSADDVLRREGRIWEKMGKKMVQEVQYKCPYCRTRFTATDETTNCPKCGGPQNESKIDDASAWLQMVKKGF